MMTTTLDTQIAAAYRELVVRERAAQHITGIPAIQNQTAINRLYDVLNHLHIASFEARECASS